MAPRFDQNPFVVASYFLKLSLEIRQVIKKKQREQYIYIQILSSHKKLQDLIASQGCWATTPEKIELGLKGRKHIMQLAKDSKMGFVPERNEFHTAFTCKIIQLVRNQYLRPFSMLPSLLKRIHTDMNVVPRLLYTGTKGRPEYVFRSEMKTSINSFRNDSFRIILFWYHVATGMNSFLNKTHFDIM